MSESPEGGGDDRPAAITASRVVGKSMPRIDATTKVAGSAAYTADHDFIGLVHACPVGATIASGTLTSLDTRAAESMPGVIAVFHRANIGPLYRVSAEQGAKVDESRPPFEDDVVRYYGQYVAVVVANTVEQARDAASKVVATYSAAAPALDEELLATGTFDKAPERKSLRGDPDLALKTAPVVIDATYGTPEETHNPIELHATVAQYDGESFTLHETSQAVVNHRNVLAQMLGVGVEQVRVVTKFLGSGFGGKLWPWPQSALAAACARNLRRPVKLVLTRQMMFHSAGHRAVTRQRVRLGADAEGRLVALRHDYANHTSMSDDYTENCGEATPFLYSTPHLAVTSALVRRNVGTPTAMRGPGAVPGLFAIESAMDELALKLGMDPVKLRVLNEPQMDESKGIPFSSRHLKECLLTGAERFGWADRTAGIGSMRRDGLVVGWGVAAASWSARRQDTEVTVELRQDGSARVACATQDIGTGTSTVLAQIASHVTGVPVARVQVVLGDTALPPGPVSGGSMVTASVTPATLMAARNAVEALLGTASRTPGPFRGRRADSLELVEGSVRIRGTREAMPIADVLRAARVQSVSGRGRASGTQDEPDARFSFHSFGAQFAEVTWQPDIARLRVSRVATVIDGGRIINPLTARNQIQGAVVMGVGMALLEETVHDPRSGRPVNDNLADYLVCTASDLPLLDVAFLQYPDFHLDELGARGIGEIGLAGVAAAITNAVHHATGVRVRKLPVRIEDLLAQPQA
jgi:xanthine dehydrogenase YagR molybdenum-binding subunit